MRIVSNRQVQRNFCKSQQRGEEQIACRDCVHTFASCPRPSAGGGRDQDCVSSQGGFVSASSGGQQLVVAVAAAPRSPNQATGVSGSVGGRVAVQVRRLRLYHQPRRCYHPPQEDAHQQRIGVAVEGIAGGSEEGRVTGQEDGQQAEKDAQNLQCQ